MVKIYAMLTESESRHTGWTALGLRLDFIVDAETLLILTALLWRAATEQLWF